VYYTFPLCVLLGYFFLENWNRKVTCMHSVLICSKKGSLNNGNVWRLYRVCEKMKGRDCCCNCNFWACNYGIPIFLMNGFSESGLEKVGVRVHWNWLSAFPVFYESAAQLCVLRFGCTPSCLIPPILCLSFIIWVHAKGPTSGRYNNCP